MSLIREKSLLQRQLGWDKQLANESAEQANLRSYIAMQFAAAGLMPPNDCLLYTSDAADE